MKLDPEKPQKISQGLDYYKAPMAQLAYEHNPHVQVTFELKNRRSDEPLSRYVDCESLQARLDSFRAGWQDDELAFLAGQTRKDNPEPLFNSEFLDHLRNHELPEIFVHVSQATGEIVVTTTGDWPLVTFWETVVMAEVNEMYFEAFVTENGIDIEKLYDEGDRRLSDKIRLLKSRPDIRFADFGTRRRFSYRWQKHVVERLATECPDNLIGTSNIWLAHELDLMPIGTYAHEMPMVYAALHDQADSDPLTGHREMLDDWSDMYGPNLSTALTDTFTSRYFFADFTPEQARQWGALRHDSGNPYQFGDDVIALYESNGIDPLSKTIVFSDGLDIDTIISLADYFKGKIHCIFGWGTTLTNDLGLKALNIVMKAVSANGQSTVKISDNHEKAMGQKEVIEHYFDEISKIVGAQALIGAVS